MFHLPMKFVVVAYLLFSVASNGYHCSNSSSDEEPDSSSSKTKEFIKFKGNTCRFSFYGSDFNAINSYFCFTGSGLRNNNLCEVCMSY